MQTQLQKMIDPSIAMKGRIADWGLRCHGKHDNVRAMKIEEVLYILLMQHNEALQSKLLFLMSRADLGGSMGPRSMYT